MVTARIAAGRHHSTVISSTVGAASPNQRSDKKILQPSFLGLVTPDPQTYTGQRRRGRVVEGAPLLRE
jgi:hypothetical protein